jgi:hypothetical protein
MGNTTNYVTTDPFTVASDGKMDEGQQNADLNQSIVMLNAKGKKKTNKDKGADARYSIKAMRSPAGPDSDAGGKRKADIHTSPKKP